MRRLHLLEVEDQPWCPAPVRDCVTDYLQFAIERLRPYRSIAPRLADALARSGATHVVDLCSGAGGPWLSLLPEMMDVRGIPLSVTLTDRYPNELALQRVVCASRGSITYHVAPVDATMVPEELCGFRTLFSGFHHFPPAEAVQILQNAVSGGQGIGIFELTERRPAPILGMALVPLVILLVTPAIRPFRWSRLLWTYLLPAVPLIGFIDGVVSCLRTYTPAELEEMTAQLENYAWEIGQERVPGMAAMVTYVLGVPRQQTA